MAEQIDVYHRWPIPKTWKWMPLGEIAEIAIGSKVAKWELRSSECVIPLIVPQDLKNTKTIDYRGRVTIEVYKQFIRKQTGKEKSSKASSGKKLLLALAESSLTGNIGILDAEQAVVDKHIAVISPNDHISPDILFYYFGMKSTKTYMQENFGAASPNQRQRISNIDIPVPPRGDQARIVERIEALNHDVHGGLKLLAKTFTDAYDILEQALVDTFVSARISNWKHKNKIGHLLRRETDLKYTPQAIYDHYRYIEASSIRRGGHLRPGNPMVLHSFTDRKNRYVIEHAPDTILYTNAQSPEPQVAMLGLDRAVCSPDVVPLVVTATDRLLPRFLLWSLIAQPITRHFTFAEVFSKKPGSIEFYEMSYPDMDEQHHIVSHLDDIQQTVKRIQDILVQDRQNMEQVEERVLTKAFRGEL